MNLHGQPARLRGGLRSPRSGPLRGSVILFVLLTLFFTAIAVSKFVEGASLELITEGRALNRERLRMEGYSALEVTLAVLQEFRNANGALHSPAEGWSDPLGFAGYEPEDDRKVDIAFKDESGKISLPRADAATLQTLFQGFGLTVNDAGKLTDALLIWMKKDYTPVNGSSVSASDYNNGVLPYLPPGRSLRSFSELADIIGARDYFYDEQGRPNDLWRQFVTSVSLYSFGAPDLNGATPGAMAAVGGYDETQQGTLSAYLAGTGAYAKQGPGWFTDAQTMAKTLSLPAPQGTFDTQIRALRINVTVHDGAASFRLTAVVTVGNDAKGLPAATTPGETTVIPSATSTSPSTPPAVDSSITGNTTTPSLNYPFTLLEIRENDEIPQVETDPTTSTDNPTSTDSPASTDTTASPPPAK